MGLITSFKPYSKLHEVHFVLLQVKKEAKRGDAHSLTSPLPKTTASLSFNMQSSSLVSNIKMATMKGCWLRLPKRSLQISGFHHIYVHRLCALYEK